VDFGKFIRKLPVQWARGTPKGKKKKAAKKFKKQSENRGGFSYATTVGEQGGNWRGLICLGLIIAWDIRGKLESAVYQVGQKKKEVK